MKRMDMYSMKKGARVAYDLSGTSFSMQQYQILETICGERPPAVHTTLREKLKNEAITATTGRGPANFRNKDCSNNDMPG